MFEPVCRILRLDEFLQAVVARSLANASACPATPCLELPASTNLVCAKPLAEA